MTTLASAKYKQMPANFDLSQCYGAHSLSFGSDASDAEPTSFSGFFTAPEMGTDRPRNDRPRNDPQPWNDPQIDPEMIPAFLLVDPEMIPTELGNGD